MPRENLQLSECTAETEHDRLREDSRRLSSLLDAVPDSVMLIGADERLIYANRAIRRTLEGLLGRPVGCVAGKRLVEVGFPPERVARWREIFVRVLAGETLTNEVLGLTGGRWREMVNSPVYDADGTVRAVAVIGRDVHARKLVERRLELLARVSTLVGLERDELLESIARLSIPELADWSGVDCIDGQRVRRSFLASRDPTKAAMRDDLLRYQPRIAERWWPELEAGRTVLIGQIDESDMRDRAPEEHPEILAAYRRLGGISAMMAPVLSQGRLIAVLNFITTEESGRRYERDDVVLAEELTRRAAQLLENERLQRELRRSEERFHLALGISRHAVFEQDRDMRYRWYSSPYLANAVGKRHEDFFAPEDAERLTRVKRRAVDRGEHVREEIQVTVAGGERVWFRLAVDPVRDGDGAITGLIGTATDITDDKRMQEALEQAAAFREQMMSVLGHDLRNPLNAIAMAATLLGKRADLPQQARGKVSTIGHAAARMEELIETLLDFGNARFRGAVPIAPVAADLAAIAREAIDELRAIQPERAILLSVHGDVRGEWDPARSAQVVSNLVANALDHGADGSPVEVVVRDEGERVSLSIHNEGTPIPPEMMRVLFEPFKHAVDGAGARGLGLGLYIAHQIVVAHGGDIEVRSTLDDGTCFVVRLPRTRADEGAATSAHENVKAPSSDDGNQSPA